VELIDGGSVGSPARVACERCSRVAGPATGEAVRVRDEAFSAAPPPAAAHEHTRRKLTSLAARTDEAGRWQSGRTSA